MEITTHSIDNIPNGPHAFFASETLIPPQPNPHVMFDVGPCCPFQIGPAPRRFRVIVTAVSRGPAGQPNAMRVVAKHKNPDAEWPTLREYYIPLVDDGGVPVEYEFDAEFQPGAHNLIVTSAGFDIGLVSIVVG